MANYFSIEILAPNGLSGIEGNMDDCTLEVEPCLSGCSNKIILRPKEDAGFKWSMAPNGDYVFASGEFYDGITKAMKSLESFSKSLRESKFPHMILLDDETNFVAKEIKHEWVDRKFT